MPLTTPKASDTTLATCPRCHNQHPMPVIRLIGGHVVDKAICPDCAENEEHQQEARVARWKWEEEHKHELAKERAWESICPPLYRLTDPARLPQDKVAAVLAWQYGPEGLLLIGPTATGKTRAVYLLLKQLFDAGRQITAFDCAAFGHECSRRFRDGTGEDWADDLAQRQVVFLDDVGKNPFTERVEAELFALVERRTANLLPIIATLNMTGEQLQAKTSQDRGAAMVRRLREFSKVILF